MTKELDELHNDVGMPAMWAGVSNMIDGMRGASVRPTSRRTFLMGAGAAAAGGAALLAVGSTPGMAAAATRRESRLHRADAAAFPPAGFKGDLAVAAVAASLENLAVYAYNAGPGCRHSRQARHGTSGRRPRSPRRPRRQHTQHAAAWNAVLKSNGKAKVTVTNPTLTHGSGQLRQGHRHRRSGPAGAHPREIAAQTYQAETSMLKSTAAIGLSASIQPVEMQHIAILYYVLGMYPGAQTTAGTPMAFNSTASAA